MAGGDAASTFTMSGGTISGNETTNANTSGGTYSGTEAVHGAGGGGVSVYGGTFIMSGTASISANTTAYPLGEGVYVRGDGTLFVMNGGEISGHNRTGVGIDHGGAFTMNGGKIHHNTNPTVNGESLINSQSNRSGGGVRVGYNADDGVSNRATFVMKGGEITDNTAPSGTDLGGYANEGGGGGVFVGRGEDSSLPPQFTMEGGTISNNRGGGVRVLVSSTFTMKDGTISGNTNGAFGGGVLAFGTFTMTGGTISGNHADKGGGVYPHHGYTMKGGTISGNTATAEGGGVWLGFSSAERVIAGGTISGNTAPRGGGVFVMQSGIGMNFKKTGGIIYGKDAVNANVATSGDKSGHALFYQQGTAPGAGDKYYDITADEGDELGVTGTTPSGDWLPSP
jgi:hypothetical protein